MKKLTIILAVSVLGWSCDDKSSEQNAINQNKDLVIGIDISHHQKNIDWKQVKEWKGNPIQFVYVKATEGATYQDKKYKTFFKEAKAHGFNTGSYHYFRTTSPIAAQFKNFTMHVVKEDQDLRPMIDVEEKKHWSDKVFHKNLKKFLAMIEEHYGVKPLIYCVNSFYNHHLSKGYEDYQFMVGRYGPNKPNMRHGGPWMIWQFSETGRVNGIEKLVDIDKLNPRYTLNDLLLPKE